jgi:hypothetical protein
VAGGEKREDEFVEKGTADAVVVGDEEIHGKRRNLGYTRTFGKGRERKWGGKKLGAVG